jgi:hypothetical protein
MRLLLLIFLFVLEGCATSTVKPLAGEIPKRICIQDNPKVLVEDFISVVQDRLEFHGVASEVFSTPPIDCGYVLKYVAWRHWDIVPYLSKAEMKLMHDGTLASSAEFHYKSITGSGGLDFSKFQGTKAKIDPLIDAMLGKTKIED